MYIYRILFFCVSLSICSAVYGQRHASLDLWGGASSYRGELVPEGGQGGPLQRAFGISYRQWLGGGRWALRLQLSQCTLVGNDGNSVDELRRQRNLHVENRLYELAFWAEWHLSRFTLGKTQLFSPYLALGIAGFKHNPTTLYDGARVALQPLGTEGQGLAEYPSRKPYALWQLAIPMQVGLDYALNERLSFGLFLGYRITFTDYLDDVSTTYVPARVLQQNGDLAVALSNRTAEYTGQAATDKEGTRRGDATNNDSYIVGGLSVSFHWARQGKRRGGGYELHRWF